MATDVADVRTLCRRLRSKQIIMRLDEHTRARGSDDGYCWCTHTMNCLGPDGRVAERESCHVGRGCFEPK